LIGLFDYGKFGNNIFHNAKYLTDSEPIVENIAYNNFHNEPIVENIAYNKNRDAQKFERNFAKGRTKFSTMNDDETGIKGTPDNENIENGKFLAFKLNETKQKNIYMDPSKIITDEISKKNDDDILKISEKIAEKKLELSDHIRIIQKSLIDRYSILPTQKPPSFQFIKDLICVNESNGGFEYVMKKIEQMPPVMEIDEIGRTLRSWCEHPEKGADKKSTLSAAEVKKIRLEKEAEQKAMDDIYDRINNYKQELSESELKELNIQAVNELKAITREEFIITPLIEAKENEIIRKRLGIVLKEEG